MSGTDSAVKKNVFTRFFSPSEEELSSYSLQERMKIPYLIGGCLLGVVMFTVLSAGCLAIKSYAVGFFSIIGFILFVVALVLIKKNKPSAASYCATISLLSGTAVVLFFAPYVASGLMPYRSGYFAVVMMMFNQIVAFKSKQLKFFIAVVFVLWTISWFTNMRPLFADAGALNVAVSCVITSIAIVLGAAFALFLTSMNDKLIGHALQKEEESQGSLSKIRLVFEESKEGLDVGKELISATKSASDNMSEMMEAAGYFMDGSSRLSEQTKVISESGTNIVTQAERVKENVAAQTESISRTSSSMTDISSSLSRISQIATVQREGMSGVMDSINAQKALIDNLLSQVEDLKKSSEAIVSFVSTIDSISAQTGLLAMNASIEAAHAGSFGKGFSVIASEIRALSEETSGSAAKITETLEMNSTVVHNTAESVLKFSAYMKSSTEQLSKTLSAIEEILSGISNMNSDSIMVQQALQTLVGESKNNVSLVDNVVKEISIQKNSLGDIADFSKKMQERTSDLQVSLNSIKSSLNDIRDCAEKNSRVGEKISQSVNL